MSDPHVQSVPAPPALLKWSAVFAAIGVGLQAVMGLLVLQGWSEILTKAHQGVGYLSTIAATVAAVGAVLWVGNGGPKGKMGHAIAMPVLMVVQAGLGELSVTWVHILLGFAILLGSGSLAMMVSITSPPAR